MMFNLSLNAKDIENLKTFSKQKVSTKTNLTGLHFTALLKIGKTFPEYRHNEKKEIFLTPADELALSKDALFLKNFGERGVKNAKSVLVVKNLDSVNKSVVKIRLEIYFEQENTENGLKVNPNLLLDREPITCNFEDKPRSKRKRLKMKRFSSVSILSGSFLALLSSISCGVSFAVKKWSLVRMEDKKCYYFDRNWWLGHSLMMVGDILHFISFYFAPAILVCTLQILTVLVTALVSSKILVEKLHKFGKLALVLCLGGCWVIVFHIPNEPNIYSIDTLIYMICSDIFLIYLLIISMVTILLMCYWIPTYGDVNSLPYTIQSAIFGSMIVIGLKGIILGFIDTPFHWLPWISFLAVAVLLILQLEYLNKALALYNTLVVTTQYYTLYSACVVLNSSALFKLWKTSNLETIFTNFNGLLTVFIGALLLTIFEEENATFDFSRLFSGP